MKQSVFFLFIFFILMNVHSQIINFDDNTYLSRIFIDTTIPNNIWQIGHPQKIVFNNAHSQPNAMVTDTLHPYPINNYSVFYLGVFTPSYNVGNVLEFNYKTDCDSINDFGSIEISLDTGKTFQNIFNVGWYSVTDSNGNLLNTQGKVFTGKSCGWYHFYFESWPIVIEDSIIYRFKFFSDGIQNNRDGWMIDDITFYCDPGAIQNLSDKILMYPNPTENHLNINCSKAITKIEVFNELGEILISQKSKSFTKTLYISKLVPGLYYIKMSIDGDTQLFRRFIRK